MKKARCVPTIVSAALSLAFPLHSVFSYLKKKKCFKDGYCRVLGPKKKKKGNGKCVLKKIFRAARGKFLPHNSPKKLMLPIRNVKSRTSFA